MPLQKPGSLRATTAFFIFGLSAASLTPGCGDKTPETTTTVINQPAPETAASVATVPGPASPGAMVTNDTNAGAGGASGTQTALADEISKKITRNTQMTGSRVNVVVDDMGVATLTGFTQNQQQKALAEKAARNTSGVSEVTNKLEIRPTGGTGKAKPAPSGPKTQIIVVPGAAPAPAPAASVPVPGADPAPDTSGAAVDTTTPEGTGDLNTAPAAPGPTTP